MENTNGMTLTERLTRYILNHHPITLDRLTEVAISKGFTELEVLEAMEQVHKDKRISVTNLKNGVTYRPAVTKAPKPMTHLTWLRDNYPYPENFEMPFPEIDMSWMFLRTKEERDEYLAAAKGVPKHMVQSKQHGRRS